MKTFFCSILFHCSAASIRRDSHPLVFTTQTQQSRHVGPPTSDFIFEHAQLSTVLLAQINSDIKFNPKIEWLFNSFDQEAILKNINILGEGGDDGWVTRHSYSLGALRAVNWLKHQYENLSDSDNTVQCELDYYRDGVAPNLICKMVWSFNRDEHHTIDSPLENQQDLSSPDRSIVLTAHYDSKGSFGSIEAPGVDDNASGCAVLLAIAQLLQKHKAEITKLRKHDSNASRMVDSEGKLIKASKNTFEVVFIHFSGTEQGLLGSESISNKIEKDITDLDKDNRKLILLLINANMISYRSRYEPRQMGLSNLGCSSESLEFMTRISNTYFPELLVGNTSIGLSDEENFQSIGIPNSIRIFESLGDSIKNPNYLKSTDTFSHFLNDYEVQDPFDRLDTSQSPEGFYDIVQVVSIAKVLLASVLELLLY